MRMTCGDGPWHSPAMSNDIAYPVFQSPDPVPALSMTRRLLELGRCAYTDVSLYAELRSVDEVRLQRGVARAGGRRGSAEARSRGG